MSYAIRNTLLLLFAFAVIAGGGFSYMHFIQKSAIEELESENRQKIEEFDEMSAVAETYPAMAAAVESAEDFIDSYNKTLFPTDDPDQIYRFLTEINSEWPRVEFNYHYNDSTVHDHYGVVRSTLTGMGSYRAVYNFINRIENSRPVQKIRELIISPVNEIGEYGNANFQFVLDSYYDRSEKSETEDGNLLVAMHEPDRFHNPFYPLIRDINPNEDNLTNVEESRLVGVGSSRVFVRNQEGQLVNLSVNDPVYLGRLQEIDQQGGRALFRLNKGGIIEEITLEVQR